jgi:hypothetical protein
MWRCVQSRRCTVTLIATGEKDTRAGTPPPVAWQSSRQLAVIPHANAAAPRVFLN